jgi:para-nitrobenzyl esterase
MRMTLTISGLVLLITACSKNDESIPTQPNIEEKIIVKAESTYNINLVQSITYAEALKHDDWNSPTTTTIPLKLDAYLPENSLAKRPALVLIHGGGLDFGSRTDPNIVNMANYFASRGWVVFSLDYRLKSDKGTVPSDWEQNISDEDLLKMYPANRDVKAAIRWLYANSETYNIDTDYITVGGGSAGALLSISLGVTDAEDYTNELSITEDPTLSTTNINQPAKVHTIIDFWGGEAYVKILELLYGLQRFDSNDAPILIAHGTNDNIVDFSSAETLKNNYQITGVDYEFHPLQGFGHSAWDATVNGKSLSDLAFDFITLEQEMVIE